MGRTQRNRCRVNPHRPLPLDHEETAINLRKFMTRNGFSDETNLKLRNFPETGRGVATVKTLRENDVLIRVPYNLMITYTTLQSVNFFQLFTPTARLTIHDLLTAFLVLERHKRDSFWSHYVNSLPSKPPWLPCLLPEERTELLPVDMRLAAKKSRRLLEESWQRVRRSIKSDWTRGVIDLHSFTWAYILVNTRAVYIDPQVVRGVSNQFDVLSDEPCMALCPFLDMFNHSYEARTRAALINDQGGLVYQLTTLTSYKKHDQVFISYGSHDNVKLMTEYGFFIPGNPCDVVQIQAEEVFKVLNLNVSDYQYKFICRHGFNKSLAITEAGPSYNLKALLFVSSIREDTVKMNFASVIYSDNYPRLFLEQCVMMCRKILQFVLERVSEVLKTFEGFGLYPLIVDFLKYRCDLIKKLCDNKQ